MLKSDALPAAIQADLLTLMLATDDVDSTIHLFTNDITPDETTLVGAFVEPTGSWYTPAATVWGEIRATEDGGRTMTAVSQQYNYTGTDPAETIYGYFVKNVTPAKLLCSRRLAAPVRLATVLDSVIVQPSITIPPIRTV